MIRLVEDRIFVDDFIDVISINNQQVNFVFKGYRLNVIGEGLMIAAFSRNEMILNGKMLSLNFNYE